MEATREIDTTSTEKVTESPSVPRVRRPIHPPGRKVGFEEAREIILRDHKEILRRLAK